jgi:2-oxoglutarate ferredoxin oxidoreductase subunit beta
MTSFIDNLISTKYAELPTLTPKDFKADIDVRWCAGCGGFSILNQVQRIMPDLGVPKEKIVFVSGIGCSSRFPYYMDVYGFHSIHGRALAIASGLKVARPDLSVWVATGDGDCMSIGGNHFIHACRRNVDLNVIMFNNEIYSLTKGQFSPTSHVGQKTKSSPLGVLDDPFNPSNLALGAGATFVARGIDKDTTAMKHLFERASKHKGFAFVEIYTNCVIFNDGAFEEFSRRETKRDRTINVEHGKPLIFGEKNDKGIKLDGYKPVVISLDDGIHSVNDVIIHNEKDSTLAFILSNMSFNPLLPRPLGVIQALDHQTYDNKVTEQIEFHKAKGNTELQNLLWGDESWEIK